MRKPNTYKQVTILRDGDYQVKPDIEAGAVELSGPDNGIMIDAEDLPKVIAMLQGSKKAFK